MKIQTNQQSRFNNIVRMSNIDVYFDKDGIAEVPKDLGEKLIVVHDTSVFKMGEVQMPEKAKEIELRRKITEQWQVEVDKIVTALENKVVNLTSEKEGALSRISTAEEALVTWKNKVNDLQAENAILLKKIEGLEGELSRYVAITNSPKEAEDRKEPVVEKKEEDPLEREALITKLYQSGNLSKIQARAMKLEFPEKEWKELTKKPLCEYIVDKSLE